MTDRNYVQQVTAVFFVPVKADMPSDPHLEGQTSILASQPAFSCLKFVLALME